MSPVTLFKVVKARLLLVYTHPIIDHENASKLKNLTAIIIVVIDVHLRYKYLLEFLIF